MVVVVAGQCNEVPSQARYGRHSVTNLCPRKYSNIENQISKSDSILSDTLTRARVAPLDSLNGSLQTKDAMSS